MGGSLANIYPPARNARDLLLASGYTLEEGAPSWPGWMPDIHGIHDPQRQRGGFRVGQEVEYLSSRRWVKGSVLAVNADGTLDLDVREAQVEVGRVVWRHVQVKAADPSSVRHVDDQRSPNRRGRRSPSPSPSPRSRSPHRPSLRSQLSCITMRAQDQKIVMGTVAASVAAMAVAVALGPKGCSRKGDAFSSALAQQCRGMGHEVPGELQGLVNQVCGTLAGGHWALTSIVAANALCYLPALANYSQWCVSRHELSHERLLRYQLAHANLPHIMGNMLTLLAVGSEVSEALGCNQLLLLALYLACGWAGGLCAALLSPNSSTVGASGSVSGVIIALSVLRPTSAVAILGDATASHPLMLLGGTLLADLSRPGVSWQGHLGGGAAGCLIAWVLQARAL